MQIEQILGDVLEGKHYSGLAWPGLFFFFMQAAVASIFKFDTVSAAAPSKSD